MAISELILFVLWPNLSLILSMCLKTIFLHAKILLPDCGKSVFVDDIYQLVSTLCQIAFARTIDQGWGLLSRFPPFRYFPNFSALSKHTLDIEYHVYIWQVSPQLSCGDTCQIWKWFKESNRYFWKIENFANGEINERSFSNPHPKTTEQGHCLTSM